MGKISNELQKENTVKKTFYVVAITLLFITDIVIASVRIDLLALVTFCCVALICISEFVMNKILQKRYERCINSIWDTLDISLIESELFPDESRIGTQDLFSLNYYKGNYQDAVNLGVFQLKRNISIGERSHYLTMLARIYYDLQDFEKLKQICMAYRRAIPEAKDNIQLQNNEKAITSFELLLNQDYAAFEAHLKENMEKATQAEKFQKLSITAAKSKYAIYFMMRNRRDEATALFREIVQEAPTMCYSKTADDYLNQAADTSTFPIKNILPDKNFKHDTEIDAILAEQSESRCKKARNFDIFRNILLLLLLLFVIVNYLF